MRIGIPTTLAVAVLLNASGHAAEQRQGSAPDQIGSTLLANQFGKDREFHQMASGNLENRGKELRAKLEQAYEKLVDSHKLQGGLHGTDVTEVVLSSIPLGTSFRDAEAILRDAGFVVGPHPELNPPPDPNRPKDWYAVVANISPFSQRFLARADLYVSLIPELPGNYAAVADLQAKFFISMP